MISRNSKNMSRLLMSPSPTKASPHSRLSSITRHMASASTSSTSKASEEAEEPAVVFRSELSTRTYVLNRPGKLNALNIPMLRLLRPTIEDWEQSPLCHLIIGTGRGRAFCAGGDVVGVVQNAASGRPEKAIQFFKEEFELDYALASLKTPYVAMLDGITMGGGVGLSINAPFRVATEKTVFAMPETKIGYIPDVGASFFMSRLDGYLGTYLALTGAQVFGRDVFDLGIATHYVASARLPALVARLHELENPTARMVDRALEEFYSDGLPEDKPAQLTSGLRAAIDSIFSKDSIEDIFAALKSPAKHVDAAWAAETLAQLELRSPTSLHLALLAIRKGRSMKLAEALKMELDIATAYCSGASPDFHTGVTSLLVDKLTTRPAWSPATFQDPSFDSILASFFDPNSRYLKNVPTTTFSHSDSQGSEKDPMQWSLPTEQEIKRLVQGEHPMSGGIAPTLSDVLTQLREMRPKQGIEQKVREVVSRNCHVVGDEGYLRWKS